MVIRKENNISFLVFITSHKSLYLSLFIVICLAVSFFCFRPFLEVLTLAKIQLFFFCPNNDLCDYFDCYDFLSYGIKKSKPNLSYYQGLSPSLFST